MILIISLKSSTGQPTFQKYFDLVGISEVQQTFDGGYIFAGNYFGIPFSYYNTALVKTDAFGDTSWVLTYSFTHRDFLKYVSQTEDSGFVVIGSSEDTINGWWQLIMTFKIDKFGNLIWSKFYEGQQGYAIEETNDNGFIMIAEFGEKVIKTNMLGDTVWTKDYQTIPTSGSSGAYIHQTPDNGYVFGGYYYTVGGTKSGCNLIKIDSLGNVIWSKNYQRSGYTWGTSMQLTRDGGYILAGTMNLQTGSDDFFLIKADANGDTLWTRSYGTPLADDAWHVREANDGGYIISGGTGYNLTYVVRTDSLGTLLWSKHFQGGARSDCQQTVDGDYIMAGGYITRTDSNGNSCANLVDPNTIVGFPNFSVNQDSVFSLPFNPSVRNLPVSITRGTSVITICNVTGIKEPQYSELNILASPNPFSTVLNISNTEIGEIYLYDITGKIILKQRTAKGNTSLNTENVTPGIYLLHYLDGSNRIYSKVIKF